MARPLMTVDVNRAGIQRLVSATSLLTLTDDDMRGFIFPAIVTAHREQEKQIFASEGAEGGAGAWPRLSAAYAERKADAGRSGRTAVKGTKGKARTSALRALKRPISQKILVWSGEMRDRFTKDGHAGNIKRLVELVPGSRWLIQIGAASAIAGYHFSGTSKMPARDMITKSAAQLDALRRIVVARFQTKLDMFRRAQKGLSRTRPGGSMGGGTASRAASPSPSAAP